MVEEINKQEQETQENTKLCEVCQNPAQRKCSCCKIAFYCSVEHQKEHWKEHRVICQPYEISHSQELGKFMKATRDLEPGDLIFCEYPLVFGPKPHKIEEGPFPCVGCCKLLDRSNCNHCPDCLWPACESSCEGLKKASYHGFECKILRLRPAQEVTNFYEYFRFDVLIILRALFLQKNQEKWDTLLNLEDHMDQRSSGSEIFDIVHEKAIHLEENYIKPLKIYEQESGTSVLPTVSKDIIHKIYGILDVNAFELTENIDAEILYPTGSIMEHNCTPNTYQSIDENNGYKITFRAALPIQKNGNITSMYTHILWGTNARREHLKHTKYFTCTCERCRDPTEFGTFLSALKCIGSKKEPCGGIQLPVKPLEDETDWVCNKCKIKLPNADIQKFVNHLSTEVDKLMERQPKLTELEEYLGKLLNFLHPNHYLIYSIKHSLVQLYGTPDEEGIEPSDAVISEKIKICEDLIDITKKIDPGNARLNLYLAVLLNENYKAKFKLLERSCDSENKETFVPKTKDILEILKETKKVLQHEKESTSGKKLFEVVEESELIFKNWMKENNIEISE